MKALAIILNIGVPGVGTFLTGKVLQAILQLVLVFISFMFWITGVLFILGIICWCAAWFWALFTAINWTPRSEHVQHSSGIGR